MRVRAREGEGGQSGEIFVRRAKILLADSHDVSLVKSIIVIHILREATSCA